MASGYISKKYCNIAIVMLRCRQQNLKRRFSRGWKLLEFPECAFWDPIPGRQPEYFAKIPKHFFVNGVSFMQCVYYERDFPNGFEEKFVFSEQSPYTITVKNFLTEDVVPLHYAATIEILLCDQLCGEIVIEGKHYPLSGKQLFVIPPYTLHSNSVTPGEGTMYVFKVCFEQMDRYINISNFLALRQVTLSQLRYDCPEYDRVMGIVRQLIRHDGDLMQCLSLFIPLFHILSEHTVPEKRPAVDGGFKSTSLQEVVRWTHENYARKIAIEEVAGLTGYSKFYFCSRFKALTGVTYLNYLNTVRLSQACLLLRSGKSVQSVCQSCGFENTSYFIQLFRKKMNTTPYQYALQQRTDQSDDALVLPGSRPLPPDEIPIIR